MSLRNEYLEPYCMQISIFQSKLDQLGAGCASTVSYGRSQTGQKSFSISLEKSPMDQMG